MKISAGTHHTAIRLRALLRCVLIAFLVTALFVPVSLQTAYGEPTSAEVQAQADEASARLAATEAEMQSIGAEYEVAIAAHDAAVVSMEEAQGRIDAAEAIIVDTQTRLGDRANQMYREGPFSFLEVVFGATSFQAFASSWDLLNMINQENAELIQANKDARAEAEAAREEYAAQEQVAADYMAECETLMAAAEALFAEQQAELAALTAEVAELVLREQEARQAEATQNYQDSHDNNYIPGDIPAGGYGGVVDAAASRIGAPYISGGTGPSGFDCSGFTSWCYSQAGRGNIGRDTISQYNNASARIPYSSGAAQPGDVLWWPPETGYTHVAIYVGGGSYIHAPLPGQSVCYSSWNIDSLIILRF